jgi:hypothetical protein
MTFSILQNQITMRVICLKILFLLVSSICCCCHQLNAQSNIVYKDSVIYRTTIRDTIVYRYDTITIKYFIYSDTIRSRVATPLPEQERKKKLLNSNNWGIGPSIGAYYSPFHGFDVNIGFGVQYYFLSIPSFKNPHMGQHRKRK